MIAVPSIPSGGILKLLIDLFSTDYGLLSLAVIGFTLAMAVFFARYFITHVDDNS